jgi:uncharacterized protein YbcI
LASIREDDDKPVGGELNAAITRAIVRIHRDGVGRGPTKARAFYQDNIVVVVLEDLLVPAERTLVAGDQDASVLRLRQDLLGAMRRDLIAAVERLTDGHVTALIGDTSIEPDVASLIFVLERPILSPRAAAS